MNLNKTKLNDRSEPSQWDDNTNSRLWHLSLRSSIVPKIDVENFVSFVNMKRTIQVPEIIISANISETLIFALLKQRKLDLLFSLSIARSLSREVEERLQSLKWFYAT